MTISYGFTRSNEGDFSDPETQRTYIERRFGTNTTLIIPKQISGISVIHITETGGTRIIPDCDGLIYMPVSGTESVVLTVRTADCMPVVLYSDDLPVIAIMHSGWKGLYTHIASEMMKTLRRIGIPLPSISAVIGPHIRACCYHVKEERIASLSRAFSLERTHFTQKADELYALDMERLLREDLTRSGMLPDRIASGMECTNCSHEYFSYYKSKKELRRNMGFIGIRGV